MVQKDEGNGVGRGGMVQECRRRGGMVQGFMRGGMVQEEGRNSAGVHERPNGAGVQEEGRNEWGHRGGAITGQLEANYGRASAALGHSHSPRGALHCR